MGVEITGTGATVTITLVRSTDGGTNWTELCTWEDTHASRVVTSGLVGMTSSAAGGTGAVIDSFQGGEVAVEDTEPPTDPTGLTATPVTSARINLDWADSTDNVAVAGYRVERCTGSGCTDFAEIATPAASRQQPMPRPRNPVPLRVRARDAADNVSGYSAIAKHN